jgi:hypothetical protein
MDSQIRKFGTMTATLGASACDNRQPRIGGRDRLSDAGTGNARIPLQDTHNAGKRGDFPRLIEGVRRLPGLLPERQNR